MRTPDLVRQRRFRRRRKLGLRMVHVEIIEEAIELLEKRGYLQSRTTASVGLAITALLSDLVLDVAWCRRGGLSIRPFPHTAHAGVPRKATVHLRME